MSRSYAWARQALVNVLLARASGVEELHRRAREARVRMRWNAKHRSKHGTFRWSGRVRELSLTPAGWRWDITDHRELDAQRDAMLAEQHRVAREARVVARWNAKHRASQAWVDTLAARERCLDLLRSETLPWQTRTFDEDT